MKLQNTFMAILSLIILASCNTLNNRYSYEPTRLTPRFMGEQYASNDKVLSENSSQERIIIYHASLNLVVKKPDSTLKKLSEIAKKYEGYVQTLGTTQTIIRVKSDKLNAALNDVSTLGKASEKIISGDDVTEQYMDYQIRLDNATNARKRYLELLAKAENVQSALLVEKELERLNGEIDSLKGKLNRLKHLSDFSTITIYLEEKVKPGILGYIGIGVYKSIKWLIVRN